METVGSIPPVKHKSLTITKTSVLLDKVRARRGTDEPVVAVTLVDRRAAKNRRAYLTKTVKNDEEGRYFTDEDKAAGLRFYFVTRKNVLYCVFGTDEEIEAVMPEEEEAEETA